jgi:FkbM family methyltransferase
MNLFVRIAGKGESIFRNLKNSVLRRSNPQYREVERWYEEDPHHLKRSDFPFLNAESVVFDLGGYEGAWTSDIFARYCCSVYVFEPVSFYAKLIQHRFADNPKIKVMDFGLADKTSEVDIYVDKFASSFVNTGLKEKPTEKIRLVSFAFFLRQHQLSQVDLVKINIEGAEYDLLYELISSGLIGSLKGLLVQFHNFIPGATQKRQEIQEKLSLTHQKVFDYPFVWEYWLRKNT